MLIYFLSIYKIAPRLAGLTIAYGDNIYGIKSVYENEVGQSVETAFHGQNPNELFMCSPENDGIATIHYDFSPDVVIQKIDVTAKKDFLFFFVFLGYTKICTCEKSFAVFWLRWGSGK